MFDRLIVINVTDMSTMFNGCSNLINLDLSHFDTSKVTNMQGMFNVCRNLTSLDLSGFDTSNVTRMYNMFSNCSNLKSITATQTIKDKILKPESNTDVPSSVNWIIK